MTNLVETPQWEPGIYQLETLDPVQGGPNGIDNLQAKQLGNRTQFLKALIEAAQNSLSSHESATDPHSQYLTTAEGNSMIASAVSALVNSSPATLDTLNELAMALGNDPNFAASIANALGLKAPINSPTLTGDPKGPTPQQFDNDLSLATTEFVQRALGSVAGWDAISLSRNLTAADIGKIFWFTGVHTLTLPTPQSLGIPSGSCVHFYSTGNNGIISAGASVSFAGRSGNQSLQLAVDDFITFVAVTGTQWQITGAGAIGKMSSFYSLIAGSGYQKLPSGLIIQWGISGAAVKGGSVAVTFPIAFPNAARSISAVVYTSNMVSTQYIVGSDAPSTTGVTLWNSVNSSGSVSIYWIAIGN